MFGKKHFFMIDFVQHFSRMVCKQIIWRSTAAACAEVQKVLSRDTTHFVDELCQVDSVDLGKRQAAQWCGS